MLLLAAIYVTSLAAIRSVLRSPSVDRALLAGVVAAFVALAAANTVYEVWMDDFQWALFGLLLAVTTQPHVALRWVPQLKRRAIEGESPATPTGQPQVIR
jgi:hypothetical protein